MSDERYAIAASAGDDGLWDWNLLTGEIYYSPRWKIGLGYSESEIENRASEWFSRVHPDDRTLLQSELEPDLSFIGTLGFVRRVLLLHHNPFLFGHASTHSRGIRERRALPHRVFPCGLFLWMSLLRTLREYRVKNRDVTDREVC